MAGTAISDIMEATRLAKGGVYGNFESKEEICFEALNFLLKRLGNSIDAGMEGKSSAKLKLFAIIDFYKDRLLKTDTGGCPILNFGAEADDTNPVVKQRVKQAIDASQKRIADVVKEGLANGEFKQSFDAGLFAVKMFTMIEGAILISRVQNNIGSMEIVADILKVEIEQNTI